MAPTGKKPGGQKGLKTHKRPWLPQVAHRNANQQAKGLDTAHRIGESFRKT
jgi:hypothetical protein